MSRRVIFLLARNFPLEPESWRQRFLGGARGGARVGVGVGVVVLIGEGLRAWGLGGLGDGREMLSYVGMVGNG